MNIDELKPESNFLKKEDLARPVKVKIATTEVVDFDGKKKLVLSFDGKEKKLACNITNADTIAACVGSKETEDWVGKEITIYNDPTVKMGNDVVGGVRVQYTPPASSSEEGFDDDIPF